MKLRTRLFVFNSSLVALTALSLGLTFYIVGERFLRNLAVQEISRSSRQSLFLVERFFATRTAEQKTLQKSTFFERAIDNEAIRSRFEDYRKNYRMYQDISFYDRNRIRRIDLNGFDIGVPTTLTTLFDRADRSDGPVYEFDLTNALRPAVHFVSRIKSSGRYVLATIPLSRLHEVLMPLSEPLSNKVRSDILIFAKDGTRIYSKLETYGEAGDIEATPPDGNFQETISTIFKSIGRNEPSGQSKNFSRNEFFDSEIDGVIHETQDTFTVLFSNLQSSRPLDNFGASSVTSDGPDWKLAFRVKKADVERPIALLRNLLLSILALLLVIALGLNRWITESMLLPIENLTRKVSEIGEHSPESLDVRFDDEARGDEIGVLTRGVKEMTQRLRANFAELSSSSKFVALGEMAAGIAHEINNPLMVIMGKAALLESNGHSLAHVHESSQKIIEMVNRISKTIHALQCYARSGENDPLGAEPVQRIIESTLDICQERMRIAQVKLEVDLDPAEIWIIARPVHVSQILMNLLNNAFDAINLAQPPLPQSDRWIRIRVREIVEPSGGSVTMSVENGGPPISDDIAGRLFEPFFTTKPMGKGTGIGLPMSRKLAEFNDASLTFDRTAGFTRFTLKFPLPPIDS